MSSFIISVVCFSVKVVLNYVRVCMNYGVYIAVVCYYVVRIFIFVFRVFSIFLIYSQYWYDIGLSYEFVCQDGVYQVNRVSVYE